MYKLAIHCILLFITYLPSILLACTVLDDAGNALSLSHPARRIISLAPDITENLFSIGAGDKIVGVVRGSDYPARAKQIPVVGSYAGIDLERIISLQPDLIVVWSGSFARQMQALKKLGIPIYITHPKKLEDIPVTLKKLGCLTGQTQLSEQVALKFNKQLTLIAAQYAKQKKVKVFYQIGSYNLMTINKESWISEAIKICGGINVFATANLIAPTVDWEAMVSANPDIIINGALNDTWKARWQKWQQISAVKQEMLFSVNPDVIDRASVRLTQGIESICQAIEKNRKATLI